jgi:hypothetical protein
MVLLIIPTVFIVYNPVYKQEIIARNDIGGFQCKTMFSNQVTSAIYPLGVICAEELTMVSSWTGWFAIGQDDINKETTDVLKLFSDSCTGRRIRMIQMKSLTDSYFVNYPKSGPNINGWILSECSYTTIFPECPEVVKIILNNTMTADTAKLYVQTTNLVISELFSNPPTMTFKCYHYSDSVVDPWLTFTVLVSFIGGVLLIFKILHMILRYKLPKIHPIQFNQDDEEVDDKIFHKLVNDEM